MSSLFDVSETTILVLDKNTGGEILHEISKLGNNWEIMKIIDHPNVLQETLDELILTKNPTILTYILESKHATKELLVEATLSDNQLVVEAAIKNSKMPNEGFINVINGFSMGRDGGIYRGPCIRLASDKRVADLSLALAKLNDDSIIETLLTNHHTSADALEYLYSLNSIFSNTYIAGHPNTPQHILNSLLSESYNDYVFYVLNNPCAPHEIIRNVASTPKIPFEHALSIAKNINTPIEVVDDFSKPEFLDRITGTYENGIKTIIQHVAKSRALSDFAAKNIMEYKWPEVTKLIASNQYADIKTLTRMIISGPSKLIKNTAENTFHTAMPRFEEQVLNGQLSLSDQVATYRRKPIQLGEFLESKGGLFITYYERLVAKQLERSILQKTALQNISDDISKPRSRSNMI